jgi:polyhydroxyalkanoate synthesis regulator phasin
MSQQPPDDDPMAGVRPYLQLASGILGMSAAKAAEWAQGIWTQGGDTVSDVVDQGVQAASSTGEQVAALLSPDQVRALVREEVDRVVRRLGFAREDELSSLRREVGRLEQQVESLRAECDARSASASQKHGHDKDGHKAKSKDKGGHKAKSKDKKDHDDDGGRS